MKTTKKKNLVEMIVVRTAMPELIDEIAQTKEDFMKTKAVVQAKMIKPFLPPSKKLLEMANLKQKRGACYPAFLLDKNTLLVGESTPKRLKIYSVQVKTKTREI
jgi:hypothetical protein